MPLPQPGPITALRLPKDARRRLEVASAVAWEALVEAHAEQALEFVELLHDRLSYGDALDRYLGEMGVTDPMAPAVRSRVFVAIDEGRGARRPPKKRSNARRTPEPREGAERSNGADGWRRFRPAALVRGVRQEQRRQRETEHVVELALARAEEEILQVHRENAVDFVALLEPHLSMRRAVEQYISTLGLSGCRAQAVQQRTMARLGEAILSAEAHP